MPAENQFKFGITCEFKPLWDEFENLAPGSKKSKMIRYLIYNFLYNNGNRTRNTFEDATSEDWEYVEGALKVYNKFIKGNTETMKEHVIDKRKFWVENYDHAVKDELVTDKELENLKKKGYSVMKNTNAYNLLPDIDQANDQIILKRMFTQKELDEEGNISSQKESDDFYDRINRVKPHQITRYRSKPDKYYVKCKWRNNSFSYYEEAYEKFKDVRKKLKSPFPTTSELFEINERLIHRLRENNLLDLEIERKYALHDAQMRNQNNLTPWEETPKELDDCLPLNKFHIEDLKNLKKLRSKEAVIYTHYTILEFETGRNPKIIGPRRLVIENLDAILEGRFYDE